MVLTVSWIILWSFVICRGEIAWNYVWHCDYWRKLLVLPPPLVRKTPEIRERTQKIHSIFGPAAFELGTCRVRRDVLSSLIIIANDWFSFCCQSLK